MLPFHCPKAVPFRFLITQYSIVYVYILFEKYKTFSVLVYTIRDIKTIGNLVKREIVWKHGARATLHRISK